MSEDQGRIVRIVPSRRPDRKRIGVARRTRGPGRLWLVRYRRLPAAERRPHRRVLLPALLLRPTRTDVPADLLQPLYHARPTLLAVRRRWRGASGGRPGLGPGRSAGLAVCLH